MLRPWLGTRPLGRCSFSENPVYCADRDSDRLRDGSDRLPALTTREDRCQQLIGDHSGATTADAALPRVM